MAQITIYLPDNLEMEARKAAKALNIPVSRWIADQLSGNLRDRWPESVLAAAGAIPDFPDADELREGYGKDAPRERFR